MDKTCDYCKKAPVANYQKVWVRWGMTKNGDYSKEPDYHDTGKLNDWDEPTGENNIHVCEKHEEELLNGDLW